MRLLLIRHGQSENNVLWENTQSNKDRVSDPAITDIGRRQIGATAKFLKTCLLRDKDEKPGIAYGYREGEITIFCSLMERAIQSGLILAKELSLPIHAHLDIHENGGLYLENPRSFEREGKPGRTKEEFKTIYPELILPDGINVSGWWNRPYEERETRRTRAKRVLDNLISSFGESNSTILLISHGGFYNYLLRMLFELKDDTDVWFDFYNGAITEILFTSDLLRISYCNRFDFMPAELVT